VVIDAKYYSETLSEYLTKATVRAGHLYQMFAYMSHLALARGRRQEVKGILLYPRTTQTVRVAVSLFDHPLVAATINLAQPWPSIRADLLALVA
jgi:5-methylcytosine-specific restriction enzyme subunit McrC